MDENKRYEFALDGHLDGVDKDIFDHLNEDAFKVHKVQLTCRDAIQSIIFMSNYIYKSVKFNYSPCNINLYVFDIDSEEGTVRCSPARATKSSSAAKSMNSVRYDSKKGIRSFHLGTGFLHDYFDIHEPNPNIDLTDFIEDDGNTFVITKENLEKIIKVR